MKLQVADVDVGANRIVNKLFAETAVVKLREDLANNLEGRLSDAIQDRCVEAVKGLMAKAAIFQPQACRAIATESLRMAANGPELVERIENEAGVSVRILSQEEEGLLGFTSAISESGIDPDKAVAWDVGGGSFQITWKDRDQFRVYQGRCGKVPVKNIVLKVQGKDTFSPNPISKEVAEATVKEIQGLIGEAPVSLRDKLKENGHSVLGIGIHPLFGLPESDRFSRERVQIELEQRLGLDDEALKATNPRDNSTYVVSTLIMVFSVMDEFNIQEVNYVGVPGANAIGVLLTPHYWEQQ